MSDFASLTARPADALLGLMTLFREDSRADKVDLGVGIYRNETGATPVMRAVSAAEKLIRERQQTKAYEGPRGNSDFCEAIEDFVFGPGHLARTEGRTLSVTTPGGCGALYLGTGLMKRLGIGRVWVSDPTWPNHVAILKGQGLEVAHYPYTGPDGVFGDMLSALEAGLKPGDGIIVQGPCHNPTGMDLTANEFAQLGALLASRGVIPFLDVAYHGFARGLTEDAAPIHALLGAVATALVSYSCSKNFGLYRERTGCFLAMGQTAEGVEAARTHVADLARISYSMPPAHGAAIVATILADASLTAEWQGELEEMRGRIVRLRTGLSGALVGATGSNDLSRLAVETGLFSQIAFSADAIAALRDTHGIYMPGSGRMNIAGLKEADIDRVAQAMASVL